MSMIPMNELFMQLGQAQTPGMAAPVPQGQMMNPAEVSNSFFNAGGVNPAELQPTPGAVQATPGMVNDLSQPLNGFDDYLNRLSGNVLEGQALQDWQSAMGFASLLSSLGAGVAGKDTPIGGFATNLNKMQQGSIMGQNARQGEGSLGGLQKASATATGGQGQGQAQPSPASMVTKAPSKQAMAPTNTATRGRSTSAPSASSSGTPSSTLPSFGSTFSNLTPDVAGTVFDSLANYPANLWR